MKYSRQISSLVMGGIGLYLLTLVQACGTGSGNGSEKLVRPVDTTINPANAFVNRFLDSAVILSFISAERLNKTDSISIIDFYHGRNYQYAWFDSVGLAEQAPNFVNLYRSYRESVNDSSLLEPRLDSLLDKLMEDSSVWRPGPEATAQIELLLTRQFFKYAERAYVGTKGVDLADLDWYIPRKKLDTGAFLDTLIATGGKDIASLLPVAPNFERMRQQLAIYADLNKKHDWSPVVFTHKKYQEGDSLPEIALLKKRLQLWGDLPATDTGARFTTLTSQGVKNFQERMGLTADGVIGAGVMAEINTPMETRMRQILINMERARWVPKPGKGRYLLVNIPSFTLHVFDSGKQVWQTPVVVGKPANNTVIFSGLLKYVVLAPYWNVPYSIVKNEMGRSASYFSRRNMEIVGRYSDGLPMVRQKPGPSNALGKVKFLFPNSYNIYLHDTPSKSLFGQNTRAFSHGCIRVQDPARLARFLLDKDTAWPPEKIEEGMKGNKEITITLDQPVPVFVGYFTVWVDGKGKLHFRKDLYGHDKKMADRLFKNK